jgi:hypothetical protein
MNTNNTMNKKNKRNSNKYIWMINYRNPSLGLTTNVRACKGAGQEWILRVTFHAPGNVRKCEGMNSHILKLVLTLRIKVSMNSQIFKVQLQGSKLIGLKSLLYH